MHRSFPLLAAAMLAGCHPAEVTLSVDPGFFPSAVAYDPAQGRYFVGSYANGNVAILRNDGRRLATIRSPGATTPPIVQLAYDSNARRLWILTPRSIETIDVDLTPTRRTVVAASRDEGRYVDFVVDEMDRAIVLDRVNRAIVEVDARRNVARTLARLPFDEMAAPIGVETAEPPCAGGPAGASEDGALMLLPDRATLIAANGGALWRIDRRSGAVERIQLGSAFPHVSQLVRFESDDAAPAPRSGAYHVAALRGRLNEVVTVHLTPDARRGLIDTTTRARFDTPLHGAFDGHQLVVLLGRLRHHPSFCGDGRPNLPARFATYPYTVPVNGAKVAAGPTQPNAARAD
jgi:hypothetical protein